MQRICVYCGSSPGANIAYRQAAEDLGRELAARGLELVYGGGKVGLMGVLARAAAQNGARVTGVIPQSLFKKEVAYSELDDLLVVSSMHERKALMVERSDAFIALPGGYGTFEEFLEALTWAQLGFHHKPCGLLNVNGYFDHLLEFIHNAVQEQFIQSAHLGMIQVAEQPASLLDLFAGYQPPQADKASWALRLNDLASGV